MENQPDTDRGKAVQEEAAHRKNLSQIPDASGFYTQPYGYVFFHYMANFGMWKDTEELYDFLSQFETVWVGNVFAIPQQWIDVLRKDEDRQPILFFYESFPGPHFIFGKDNPQFYEAWQVDFLDNHREDFYSINPLIPPDFLEYTPGQWAAGQQWSDYFVNYGNREAEDFLIHQFYDIKRSEIGYDGLFFDLMGGAFINGAFVQDPEDQNRSIRANTQYNSLSETRESPELDYDTHAANFLARLREKNPDPDAFPVWGNQAYRSNRPGTDENDYYKYLTHDLSESTFTTWLNTKGWKAGVRVYVDESWVESANPVETRIIPFFEGVDLIQSMADQRDYAKANYSNEVKIVTTNYLRPYYEPYEDGYRATVDRDAIYYGYAASKAIDIPSFNWDFFDTVSNLTGVFGAPLTTGLPLQGYFRWSDDPIYFLDIGDYMDSEFQTFDLENGGSAVVRFMEKGFVLINTSQPAKDIVVDLSDIPGLKGSEESVFAYYNHFDGSSQTDEMKTFTVPAAYRPLEDVYTNSARVYSYLNEEGNLIETGGEPSPASVWSLF